jgi:hypothetical protein
LYINYNYDDEHFHGEVAEPEVKRTGYIVHRKNTVEKYLVYGYSQSNAFVKLRSLMNKTDEIQVSEYNFIKDYNEVYF